MPFLLSSYCREMILVNSFDTKIIYVLHFPTWSESILRVKSEPESCPSPSQSLFKCWDNLHIPLV